MPDTTTEPVSLDQVIQSLRSMMPSAYAAPERPRDHTKPHVSDLIQIAKPYTGPHFEGLGDLGLLWELALRPWVADYAIKNGYWFLPGTIVQERDGILGSLDGLMIGNPDGQDGVVVVVDTKMRFSKKEMDFSVRSQMKAYCHMVGATTAILPVGRMLARPLSFSAELIIMTFTDIEIEENWRMLMAAKEQWRPPNA